MKKITTLISAAILVFTTSVVSAQNLITSWDAGGATGTTTAANKWGFGSTFATAIWGDANGGGIRYRDNISLPISGTTDSYSGRQFLYRWDGDYWGSTMSLGIPTSSGTGTGQAGITMVSTDTYTVSGYYSWLNNGTIPTYQFAFSNSPDGEALGSENFTADAKEVYYPFSYSFTPGSSGDGDYFFQIRQLGAGSANGTIILLADLKIEKTSSLGVNDLERVSDAKIYPNPVQDKLNIATDSEIASINIYDLLGRSVLVKDKAKGVDLKSIDVTGLKNGTYVLHVVTTENKVEVLKFLK